MILILVIFCIVGVNADEQVVLSTGRYRFLCKTEELRGNNHIKWLSFEKYGHFSNPTSSEDLSILEPPDDGESNDAPGRFVFQDIKDFSPRGSFGFLAVNSSYKAYFPQNGGTEVLSNSVT